MVKPSCSSQMLTVGIVGLGSRGLSVLDRILAIFGHRNAASVKVVIFEPNEPGVGIHNLQQPDYLLLNTVSSQLSMFADLETLPGELRVDGEVRAGPNFYDWCMAHGIRLDDASAIVSQGGRKVSPTDFLPRRLLGEYLNWFYDQLVAKCPDNVELILHRDEVIDLTPLSDGRSFILHASKSSDVIVDHLVLTVGHTARLAKPCDKQSRRLNVSYPLDKALACIRGGESVGVEGFGLVAQDVIASLTLGRGGKFLRADGHIRYDASGREPTITLYSRHGLPFNVRPDITPNVRRHRPVLLTPAFVGALRAQQPERMLDFETDILPVMMLEMRSAFHITMAAMNGRDASRLIDELTIQGSAERLASVLSELDACFIEFHPEAYMKIEIPPDIDGPAYTEWVYQSIEADLSEGRKGTAFSPLKAALEIWRDLRDILRLIADQDGLTPESRLQFYRVYAPLVNRLVGGPQKERHEELLTLLDAGIVRIAPGIYFGMKGSDDKSKLELVVGRRQRTTILLDWVVAAHIPLSGLVNTASNILQRMHALSLIRPLTSGGMDTIEVNRDNNVIDRSGVAVTNIWALGPIAEGSSYYNHYVPSGGGYSRAFTDAHLVALGIFYAAVQTGKQNQEREGLQA